MKKIIFLLILFTAVLAAPRALAAPVTATNGAFILNYTSPLFDVQNAAPGGEYSSAIAVTNTSDISQNLQLALNVTADPKALADFLYLKVEDGQGNCLWNCDETMNVSQLDGREMVFSDIAPNQTENYILVLYFSANADNTLENAAMTFDMTLGFANASLSPVTPAVVISNHHAADHDHHASHHHSGAVAPAPATPIGQTGAPAVLAAGNAVQNKNGNNGNGNNGNDQNTNGNFGGNGASQIKGASTNSCVDWPLWVWLLALAIFFLVFGEDLRRKYKKERIGWKSPLLWIILAIVFWNFFDACRTARWFLYLVIILSILGYSAYLEALRRKMKLERPQIESEPDPFSETPEESDEEKK